METFTDRSIKAIIAKKSILCVGLDPQPRHMPPHLVAKMRLAHPGASYEEVMARVFLAFNKGVIDAIKDVAVWVKPQSAFYEVLGRWGAWALEETIRHAREQGLLIILDAKRGDGGDTAEAYAQAYLGEIDGWPHDDGTPRKIDSPLRVDALTIHGYIGEACVMPFVREMRRHGTGAFVVDKTSFKPNSDIEQTVCAAQVTVWERLAHLVKEWGSATAGVHGWNNLGVVMGATYPDDTPTMREILPKSWFLVPGFGNQGATADDAVSGADQDGFGITVNSSRDIHNAWRNEKNPKFHGPSEHYAVCAGFAALDARDRLNAALLRAGKGRGFLKA